MIPFAMDSSSLKLGAVLLAVTSTAAVGCAPPASIEERRAALSGHWVLDVESVRMPGLRQGQWRPPTSVDGAATELHNLAREDASLAQPSRAEGARSAGTRNARSPRRDSLPDDEAPMESTSRQEGQTSRGVSLGPRAQALRLLSRFGYSLSIVQEGTTLILRSPRKPELRISTEGDAEYTDPDVRAPVGAARWDRDALVLEAVKSSHELRMELSSDRGSLRLLVEGEGPSGESFSFEKTYSRNP